MHLFGISRRHDRMSLPSGVSETPGPRGGAPKSKSRVARNYILIALLVMVAVSGILTKLLGWELLRTQSPARSS